MTPEDATTLGGAFVFGVATSLHCVGMCGPLACVACQRGAGCARLESAVHYQAARLLSYALLGALAGGLGWLLRPSLPHLARLPLAWLVPALLGGALVLVLLRRGRRWQPQRLLARIAPGWIGLATPLIPCGPLYLMIGLCSLAGSAARGATLALVFGLGTLPLLWLAQHQWGRLQRLLGARRARLLQRAVLIAASALVAWRLLPSELVAGPACGHLPAP